MCVLHWTNSSMENKAFILRYFFLLSLLQTFVPGWCFNLEKVRISQFIFTTYHSVPIFTIFDLLWSSFAVFTCVPEIIRKISSFHNILGQPCQQQDREHRTHYNEPQSRALHGVLFRLRLTKPRWRRELWSYRGHRGIGNKYRNVLSFVLF